MKSWAAGWMQEHEGRETTVETQRTADIARQNAVRQRIASVDEPTHPLRRHLHAARGENRLSRLKSLFRLRFRASGAAA